MSIQIHEGAERRFLLGPVVIRSQHVCRTKGGHARLELWLGRRQLEAHHLEVFGRDEYSVRQLVQGCGLLVAREFGGWLRTTLEKHLKVELRALEGTANTPRIPLPGPDFAEVGFLSPQARQTTSPESYFDQ